MKTISVAVLDSDYESFRDAARSQGRSIAQLIRDAMALYRREHLERLTALRDVPVLVGHRLVARLPDRGEIYDEVFARDSPSGERWPMRCATDTNVLVYAHLPVFPESETVRDRLRAGLADKSWQFALTASVLHEFVHVVTDPWRFDPPVAMVEALALAKGYLGRTNVDCLAIDAPAVHLAFKLLDTHRLGRKRIADTLLAATLLRHGMHAIMTCNPGDFATFDQLAVIDPREAIND